MLGALGGIWGARRVISRAILEVLFFLLVASLGLIVACMAQNTWHDGEVHFISYFTMFLQVLEAILEA